ncbi:hypothetical protein BDV37DRAFT_289365 [Aspergillus pseudonomiae]|uniref:Erythromycin biosynthesis protein CIII-like C-terminal domain-containing protein n=1 Tax=Aspergillus pseudonomiae TaxID=1506151 RepID=A0A5N7CTK9_9EURO|nr:uncharacterized protein BDV37DRAFT_289365 [Aspergillus pseudonomiae]KAE8397505.1 hypothetical protein BDV37DRAFT_289365 [Aspergillus pseudonomiae]
MMMWEGLGDLINQFRKDELGPEPLDSTRAASIVHRLNVPYTYFAGTTPIYIGFGSIVVDDPAQLTKTLFEAVRLTGQRALISKGWGKLGGDVDIPDNIFLLGNCPHDWLFMHVSCVAHHGGAGTTAAGLRQGCPTVIVPFFGDQPFWGSIVARAGAEPPPVPFKQLTAEDLPAAINKALEPSTRHAASEIRDRMASETGTENAVQSFHRHLNLGRLHCVICPDRPAVWWVRNWNIKHSSFAAGILAQTGHIDSKSFALYRAQEYETDRDPNDSGSKQRRRREDDSLQTSGRNSASHKRGAAKNSRAKSMVAETEYIATRLLKKTAKAIVSVPADLTLSLSKGFHNAPKYYHDTTVRKLARVDGVQSGLHAAGKEFTRGFDDGISGVLLLPAHG